MLKDYYQNHPIISKARDFATECHSSTNHKYDGKDYSFHLDMVFSYGVKYSHLLENESDVINALCGCWVHDVIEDTRQTYNDVKSVLGVSVADISFDLTNEKGKTRAERANQKYYESIKANKNSLFVKICDRLANIEYSISTNSKMKFIYKKEFQEFKSKLYDRQFDSMFLEIENILSNI